MNKNNRLLYFLALLKFILPFLLQSSFYEPHRDELLYLAEGRHLAWGFMEVPPLLSLFAGLTNLFGGSMFWIKCWPSLFGTLTFIISGKIILSLGGKSFALFLCFLAFVTGAYLRVHYLFQPNFLEIFFWTMLAYSLIRYVQTEKNNWLYLFGISAGLGMMSKYSVLFFITSLLVGLLLTKQRKIFANKHFYFAGLIGFVLFLPNLIWQWLHHFPLIYHMRELQQTQLQYLSPIDFLKDQIIMNFPCAFVWLAGCAWVLFSKKGKQLRFIGWSYVFLIIILLIGRGKNYYSLGVYPVLLAIGAYKIEQWAAYRLFFLRYIVIACPLVLSYFFIPILLPVYTPEKLAAFYKKWHIEKTGALRWEDQKNHPLPQDFSDMLGWKEMTKKMAKAYGMLSAEEKKSTIVFCDNYGQAGAVNYFGPKFGLPPAYSDNASFLYWMPDSLNFDNVVLLTDDQNEMSHPFINDFKTAILVDSVINPYAREKGDLIILLKGGNDAFKKMFIEKIEKDKHKTIGY
jgi:hypothetical protein